MAKQNALKMPEPESADTSWMSKMNEQERAAYGTLNKEDKQLLSYLIDPEVHARDCIKIRDHNTAQIVSLVYNKGQGILHTVTEKQKAEKGFVKIIFLKSRRFGGSTYVEGRFYSLTSQYPNRNAFVIGHEEESTRTLFQMTTLMHEQNPIPPATRKSNAQELIFDNPKGTGLKSQYRLATAKNVDAGKSQGIHYLHGSEEGMWPAHSDELLNGLFQCIPDPPAESEIFRESTAKGFGNSFQIDVFKTYAEGQFPYYEEDNLAFAWSNPDTDWILVFIPWFIVERYVKEFENDEQKQRFIKEIETQIFDSEKKKFVDTEEKRLKEKFGLAYNQLNWRRWAIRNKCRGSKDLFNQEYPGAVLDAFLSKGSNVYPKELCDEIEAGCEDPILTGDLVVREGKTRVRPNKFGKFRQWEKPDFKETYFGVIDSAGGKKINQTESEKKSRDPDKTCIDIFNHRTGIQCAQVHGDIDYDLIADVAEMLGNLYGRCPFAVELQNHGYTVVAGLDEKQYPLYEHRDGEAGWLTTRKTKPQMVDGLYKMTRDGDIQLRCRETVAEMRTFIEISGTYGAASGCKDDRVDTAGIASQLMTILPRKFEEFRAKRERPLSQSERDWKVVTSQMGQTGAFNIADGL